MVMSFGRYLAPCLHALAYECRDFIQVHGNRNRDGNATFHPDGIAKGSYNAEPVAFVDLVVNLNGCAANSLPGDTQVGFTDRMREIDNDVKGRDEGEDMT